jgi:hypothetical protein
MYCLEHIQKKDDNGTSSKIQYSMIDVPTGILQVVKRVRQDNTQLKEVISIRSRMMEEHHKITL